jgi:DNA-directed RNA polymerase subunit RPC12/RpoP
MADSNEPRQDAPQDEPRVSAEWACPECGERRMDSLTCEEDSVTCATCGKKYILPPPKTRKK